MISVKGLNQSFGDKQVLKDINLEVADGEILAVMGSSGGGKTTLLRCISGLLKATSGSVSVDGIDVEQEPDEARRRMGMVFQSAALFDSMNVYDNVLFGIRRRLDLKPAEEKKLLADSLSKVDLADVERKMPAELSGGMRKRVGIARALALSPKIMLYDEPTTGLDPITTYTIDSLIVSLRKEMKMTSVLVSHDVNSVARTADRIAFLHDGLLVFEGTPKEFLDSKEPNIEELVRKSQATTLS